MFAISSDKYKELCCSSNDEIQKIELISNAFALRERANQYIYYSNIAFGKWLEKQFKDKRWKKK